MKKAWSILPDEWKPILKERGMRAFRADQILQALYRDYITDWDQATTLPKDFREQLKTEFPITKTKTLEVSKSSDGTQKLLIGLVDGESVETVLIPATGRFTQCISTQVGCGMGCAFCASGARGVVRSLTADEIVAEYMAGRALGEITNIVVMGMGEPDRIVRGYLLYASEYEGVVRHDEVGPAGCGFVHQFRGAVEAQQDSVDLLVRRAHDKPAVVPAFLDRKRSESLYHGDYVPDSHNDFLTSTSCLRISFRLSSTFTLPSTFFLSAASFFEAPSRVSPCSFTRRWICFRHSRSSAVKRRLPLAFLTGLMYFGKELDQNLTRDVFSPRISAASPMV